MGRIIKTKTNKDNVVIEQTDYKYISPTNYSTLSIRFSGGKEVSRIEEKFEKIF